MVQTQGALKNEDYAAICQDLKVQAESRSYASKKKKLGANYENLKRFRTGPTKDSMQSAGETYSSRK